MGVAPMNRAVFLDRDGILNRAFVHQGKPYPPRSLDEFEILPGVTEALERLRLAHFLLIVVTNQPDVSRGTQIRSTIEAMHKCLKSRLPLKEIIVCYEDDETSPERKPNPGMLLQAADRHHIDLTSSFMVGDRWRDIEAGRRAGCQTIFVDYHYTEPRPDPPANYSCSDLQTATDWILEEESKRNS